MKATGRKHPRKRAVNDANKGSWLRGFRASQTICGTVERSVLRIEYAA